MWTHNEERMLRVVRDLVTQQFLDSPSGDLTVVVFHLDHEALAIAINVSAMIFPRGSEADHCHFVVV